MTVASQWHNTYSELPPIKVASSEVEPPVTQKEKVGNS